MIDKAGQLLKGTPVPEGFVARLFARRRRGHRRLHSRGTRRTGDAGLRLHGGADAGRAENPHLCPEAVPDTGETRTISVIELLNDDMPFLVDSIMAELAARNIAVRLVVHPILAVARDQNGQLRAGRRRRARPPRRRAARKPDAYPCRPHRRSRRRAGLADRWLREGAGRCHGRGARLAADAWHASAT